jgi:hypothetical protein
MGFFTKEIVEPVKAVGSVLDNLFTSDEEKLNLELLKQRLEAQPNLAQSEINKVQASHRSIWVAGARPALLWVCAAGYTFAFLVNPFIQWYSGAPGPELPMDSMGELTLGMLGLAGLRTVEKIKGVTK